MRARRFIWTASEVIGLLAIVRLVLLSWGVIELLSAAPDWAAVSAVVVAMCGAWVETHRLELRERLTKLETKVDAKLDLLTKLEGRVDTLEKK